MSNLTRYIMEHGKYSGLSYINEVPHPTGEWVKFDDIKELLNTDVQQLKAEIAALVVKVDAIPQRDLPLMVGEFIERMRQLSAV